MNSFFAYLLTGLLSGSIYGIMGIGIVVIYKSSSIFNFGHGELVAIGCFIAWSILVPFQLPLWMMIFSLVGISIIMGLFIERFVLRPLIGKPILVAIMVTIGLGQFSSALILLLWPGTGRVFPHFLPSGKFNVLGFTIVKSEFLAFGVCVMTLLILTFIFKYTRMGLAMRATAEDHQLAQSDGMKVTEIFALSWIIAIIMATIGGILVGYTQGVSFWLADIGMKAFPAVIFGGLESITGAFIGGLVVGVVENLGGGYLDSYVGGGVKEVMPFIIMLAVLIFKPFGLFGYRRIERI